jgi:hypothetical protein
MFRSGFFVVALACLATVDAFAEQPGRHLIVAANRQVASVIEPLSSDATLVVLFQDQSETYEMINTRALRMRHASSFFHTESLARELTPIFIERFRNHGVRIVNLPVRLQVAQFESQLFNQPTPATLANLQELP